MLSRRQFLAGSAACGITAVTNAADIRISNIRTIASLPQAAFEMKERHDGASAYSAELLPEDEPFEITNFTPYLTTNDEFAGRKGLLNTSIRRHVFSVGLEVLLDDQKHLPVLSREQILTYLKSHFVSIQARIYREPVSGELYLGHRCLAATRSFRDGKMSKAFSPTVAQSIANTRSVGLLVPKNTPPTPRNLRTLVLIHKNQFGNEKNPKSSVAKTAYEYLFVRAVQKDRDQLELHAFVTSEERTKFHWLSRGDVPSTPSNCSIRAAVHFTEYSHQGLYPKSAVIRRSMVVGQKDFEWAEIEKYAGEKFDQSPYEKMPEIMDAIISGKLASSNGLGSR